MLRDGVRIFCLAALLLAAGASLTLSEEDGGLLWVYTAPDTILFAPSVAADGTSYISTGDQRVRAISPSGKVLWAIDPGGKPTTGIAVQGGLLIFGTSQAELAAYGTNGHKAWRKSVDDIILSTPAVASGGTIYAATRKGTLYAVSPKGRTLWIFETGDDVVFSPAVALSGRIYVASTKNFFALEPGGAPVWISSLATPPGSQMAIDAQDGVCYVDAKGTLHHLTAKGGKEDWADDPSVSTFTGAPVASSDTVYLCEGSGTAPPTGYSISGTVTLSPDNTGLGGVSISTGTGGSATTASDGTYTVNNLTNGSYTVTPSLSGYTFNPTSTPVTIDGASVTGTDFTATTSSFDRNDLPQETVPPSPESSGQNQTMAYKIADGTAVWTQPPTLGNSFAPAVVTAGDLLIPSDDNDIYLLDSTGGKSKTVPFGQAPHDVTLAATTKGNRIYVACADRFLFCVATNCVPDASAPWGQLGAGPKRISRREQ